MSMTSRNSKCRGGGGRGGVGEGWLPPHLPRRVLDLKAVAGGGTPELAPPKTAIPELAVGAMATNTVEGEEED